MVDIYSIMYTLESTGVYQYFLPFLLIFVIVFAILEKTFIFGSVGRGDEAAPKTNINIVVAFIISAFVIVQTDLVNFVYSFLSRMTMFMIIGIMFMLIVAMFATRKSGAFEGFGTGVGVIIAIIALLWSLSSSVYGDMFPYWFYLSESTLSALLLVGVLVGVIMLVAKSGSSARSSSRDRRRGG